MATSYKDFIKANPGYVGVANTSNWNKPKKKDEPKSKKGSGNQSWLSSIISELGGAGGAVGGAATGAALGSVVPGIGNIIGGVAGGIVGGFTGGFGGRALENQIRDNEMRVGDAAKEGLVSGAFGAIGPAWQGARGLGVIGKAGGGGIRAGANALANVSDDATRAAMGKAISQGGKKAATQIVTGSPALNTMQIAGRGMSQNAIGIGQGAKAPGMANLGAGQSDDLLKTLTKDLKLKLQNPERMQRALEPIIKNKGSELANIYGKSSAKYSASQLKSLTDDIARTLADDASFQPTKSVNAQLTKQLGLIKKAKSPQELWRIKKDLGKSINFGKNADAKLVDREAVARVMRTKIDDLLNASVPDAKASNAVFSKAMTADELLRLASKPADKTGLVARIGTSGAFRNAEAKTGGLIEALGNAGASNIAQQGGRVASGMATRGIANQFMQPVVQDPTQEEDPMMQDQTGYQIQDGGVLMPDALYGNQAITGGADQSALGGAMGGFEAPQPQEYNPYAPQNLQQSVSQIMQQGGDMDDVKDFLSIAKVLNELTATTGGAGGDELNVTKPTSEKFAQANAGMQALGQLEQLLSQDPGVLARTRTPGRGLNVLGIGSTIKNATGTGEFDTLGFAAVDNMLRIATGAAAPDTEIRRYMNQYLPAPGDSPETVQVKLNSMRQQFNSILDLAQPGAATGATDFQSAINQYSPY